MVQVVPMHTPESARARSVPSSGGRLVATDGRTLPLTQATLRAEAGGGIARVVLEQRFQNPHDQRLAVKYLLPLPADGAVSGFRFQIGGRVITGEVDRKARARARFEEALVSGKTAALLEEDRSSLFTQEIGNIPPHSEVIAEIIIDQPLIWLNEGAWEWRFPTVVGPRYMSHAGRVADAEKITVDVSDKPLSTRASIALSISDTLLEGRRPESPSHAITADTVGSKLQVGLRAQEGARLDRDIVVRWPVAEPKVGLSIALARPSAPELGGKTYALLTIVPPAREANIEPQARDLIVLIDTSGSMSGRPLEQSKRVVSLMIESMADRDRLEMIEFGSSPRRWQKEPVLMTQTGRHDALRWVRALNTGGGTEMRMAVLEALKPLRPDAQRQIVLVTDGYVGFEQEIVREVLERLPRGSRLHTVGVGSGVNRSLTQPAARAGAGVELIIGLEEDPERCSSRLLARLEAPIVTELSLDAGGVADHAPRRMPDLFANSPVKVAVELAPSATEVRVRGKTARGHFDEKLRVQPIALGEGLQGIAALFARERVEDCEAHLAAGGDRGEIDGDIERIGLDFQIATRMTSWVAITEERTVDPSSALAREVMPHEVPYGASVEGLGLRTPAPVPASGASFAAAKIGSMAAFSDADEMDLSLDEETRVSAEAFEMGDEPTSPGGQRGGGRALKQILHRAPPIGRAEDDTDDLFGAEDQAMPARFEPKAEEPVFEEEKTKSDRGAFDEQAEIADIRRSIADTRSKPPASAAPPPAKGRLPSGRALPQRPPSIGRAAPPKRAGSPVPAGGAPARAPSPSPSPSPRPAEFAGAAAPLVPASQAADTKLSALEAPPKRGKSIWWIGLIAAIIVALLIALGIIIGRSLGVPDSPPAKSQPAPERGVKGAPNPSE